MKIALVTHLLGGFLIVGSALAQNTITVDNNPGSVAMFDNFADAYDAAEPGDTILLAGSSVDYGIHTINKRLHIEGPGYFLAENGVPGLNKRTARIHLNFVNSLQFGNPSNSKVSGISLGGASVMEGCTGILFDKVRFSNPSSSIEIRSPVVIRRSVQDSPSSFSYGFIIFYASANGSVVSNSNLQSLYFLSDCGASIDKCIINGYPNDFRGNPLVSVSNSIFTSSSGISGNPSISHCIAINNILPSGSGNLNNQFLTGPGGVFQTFNEDTDIAVLRSDSPAKGAGTGGSDIGIEGGVTPYVPGGVPARPRLTLLSAPNSATNASGLTFQVGAQAFGD